MQNGIDPDPGSSHSGVPFQTRGILGVFVLYRLLLIVISKFAAAAFPIVSASAELLVFFLSPSQLGNLFCRPDIVKSHNTGQHALQT